MDYPIKSLNLVPEHDCTIEYKGNIHFKFTITQDKKIRLKVPDRFIGTQFEQDWIDTSKEFAEALIGHYKEIPITLRVRSFNIRSPHNPRATFWDARHKPIITYDIFNKKLEVINGKV